MSRIVTGHIKSPLPSRCFDWVAYYDEEPHEQTLVGHGVNEWDAIRDLIDQDLERAEIEGYYDREEPREYEPDLGC